MRDKMLECLARIDGAVGVSGDEAAVARVITEELEGSATGAHRIRRTARS